MEHMLEGKRLLILGGMRISCEIVRRAHELGMFVGVTDYNPPEKSPAKAIADRSYQVSTTDVDAVVKLIAEEQYDGVITGFVDVLLPYYAEICEKAGLPCYGTKEQFEIFINKDRYKALMREYGVPTIPEYEVDLERFDETTEDIVYPVLVKPADSSGARGITICRCRDELKEALSKANGFSHTGTVLVEQYIDEQEATVFWVFQDGEYYLATIGNRHVKHNQEGVIPLPVGYTYPSAVIPRYIRETMPQTKEMFRAAGIRNGMMFMQCKIVDGLCLVYDIGYRLTGSLEYKNLLAACGYDPLAMMLEFAVTGSMGEPDLAGKADPLLGGQYSYNVSCLSKPGRIAELKGVEEVKKMPGVIDAVPAHYPGEEITESMRGLLAQITVRVLGMADSVDDMRDKMLRVQDTVSILSDTGEELMLPGIEPGDYENAGESVCV